MKRLGQTILALEPLVLAAMLLYFWTPNLDRIQSLLWIAPFVIVRLFMYRRVFPPSPLNPILIALLILAVININTAPFHWDSWILGRPIMGVVVATSFADWTRRYGKRGLDWLLLATALLGLLIGFIALFWSQWIIKSVGLQPIIDLIPPAPQGWLVETFIGGGFNVNEIAGGMVWLLPVTAVIAMLDWKLKQFPIRKWVATAAFALLSITMFLGQSRFAIGGAIIAMVVLVMLIYRPGWTRRAWLIGLALVTAAEIVLLTGILNPIPEITNARDESSIVSRLDIWRAGIQTVIDYPLTGVGMNQFRTRQVRALYPVTGYEQSILPHAHNEFIQISADFGVPGLILLVTLYGAALQMLWRNRRAGSGLALGIAAGLVAHLLFGMGDAITLFDRFIFVFWWLIGLAMSIDVSHERFIEKPSGSG